MFSSNARPLHPIWAFLISAALSVAAFFIAGTIAEALAGPRRIVMELIFRVLLMLLPLGGFAWLLIVADRVNEHRLAAQGLPRATGWLRQFALGYAIGFLLTVLAILPLAVATHPSIRIHFSSRILARSAAVLIILIAGALAEELMFRGYPFQHLEQGIGAPGTIIVFSVLFGAVHLANPGASVWGLINTVAIGVLLSLAYLRTRALWFPWGIHFGWNCTLGFVFGLPVSGFRIFNTAVRTTVTGPRWLTGGSYGVEASAAGAIAVLIGIAIVSKLPLARLSQPAPPAPDAIRRNSLFGI